MGYAAPQRHSQIQLPLLYLKGIAPFMDGAYNGHHGGQSGRCICSTYNT